MRYSSYIFLILFLYLAGFRAMAMADNYVSVNCNAGHVVITSDYAEPPPVDNPGVVNLANYGQASQCRLKSGDIVRVRMGFDYDAYHYDQNTWVSAWFDRMKWLSKVNVEVIGTDDPRAKTISIDKSGVTVCTVFGSILLDDDNKNTKTPSCKYTGRAKLANIVDVKEPAHLDHSHDPLNPPVIVVGKQKALCEAMAAVNKDTRLNGAEPVEHLWLNLPEGQLIRVWSNVRMNRSGWFASTRSDFENNGLERHIYYRPVASTAYTKDLYVLLDNDGYNKYLKAGKSVEPAKYAEAVWPTDWARPSSSQSPGVVLAIDAGSGEKITMLVNHISISPFKYKGETYLLLSDEGDDPYAFVIKPHAKGGFDQVCAFTVGTPNF
jgi:hypothetical protein